MYVKLPNQAIKEMLQERGIKQIQVAFDLEIPYSRFNRIAKGWEIPNAEQQKEIAEYLDVEASDLFGAD